jgi:hypothetical protein
MKNFLIKLSRNKSLIVPVVTLLVLAIGISGYYIQDRQLASKKAAEDSSGQTDQTDGDSLTSYDNVDEAEVPVDDGATDEGVSPANNGSDVSVSIETQDGDSAGQIKIYGVIGSNRAGKCNIRIDQGDETADAQTVDVREGTCEATLSKPASGTWQIKVSFTSEDGEQTGSHSQDITF